LIYLTVFNIFKWIVMHDGTDTYVVKILLSTGTFILTIAPETLIISRWQCLRTTLLLFPLRYAHSS